MRVTGANPQSLYAAAAARLVRQGVKGDLRKNKPASEILALREAPTLAFASSLSLGGLSSREVLDAARNHSPATPGLNLLESSGTVNITPA